MAIDAVKPATPFIEKAAKCAATPFRLLADSKFIEKHDKFNKEGSLYFNGFGVISIVAKDALGCYYYVTQSLNNKNIPEDKRKFVASLDLVNGILMNMFQLGMFFTIGNKAMQSKMFDKAMGKFFERSAKKSMAYLVDHEGSSNLTKIQHTKAFNNIKAASAAGFAYITTQIAATIIGKRMLVPFLSTPLASWAKEKFMTDDKKAGADKKSASSAAESTETKKDETTAQQTQPINFSNKNVEQMYKQIKHIN